MSQPHEYGESYWRIVGKVGDIHLYADDVEIIEGSLVFRAGDHGTLFAVAPGQWDHFYAASQLDGGPVAVAHWTPAFTRKTKARGE